MPVVDRPGLVQPTLLERLIDDGSDSSLDARAEGWGMPASAWRDAVVRDLERLLSTPATFDGALRHALTGSRGGSLDDLPLELQERIEPALASTLNYGVPPIAGTLLGEEEVETLAEALRLSIERFEPRIIPESISVTPIESDERWNFGAVVGFRVEAEIGMDPVPLSLQVRTLVDTAAGMLRSSSTDDASTRDVSGA